MSQISKLPAGFWDQQIQRLTDCHCHLGDMENVSDHDRVLKSGINIHHMSITPQEYLERRPKYRPWPQVKPALGLYPLYVEKDSPHVEDFFKWLPESHLVGEVGLDFSPHYPDPKRQVQILSKIISECNRLGGRCLSLHSRKAALEVLNLCRKDFSGSMILHWFSGPCESLFNLPEHIYFSINPAMLKSRNGKTLISVLPKHKILLESDAPYVKVGGQASHSLQLIQVVESLAHRWKLNLEETITIIEQNTSRALQNVSDARLPTRQSLPNDP